MKPDQFKNHARLTVLDIKLLPSQFLLLCFSNAIHVFNSETLLCAIPDG